jgi:hypothetical protein
MRARACVQSVSAIDHEGDAMTADLNTPAGLLRRAAAGFCCLGAVLAPLGAVAQGTIDREAQSTFQKEAASCRGTSRQDHATCMREAAAARDETRRGRLADRGANYGKNAAQRCDALPDTDRKDCLMRAQGQGKASGSVDAGGIYRETVTRTPEPVPPPKITDTTPGAPQN